MQTLGKDAFGEEIDEVGESDAKKTHLFANEQQLWSSPSLLQADHSGRHVASGKLVPCSSSDKDSQPPSDTPLAGSFVEVTAIAFTFSEHVELTGAHHH